MPSKHPHYFEVRAVRIEADRLEEGQGPRLYYAIKLVGAKSLSRWVEQAELDRPATR